MHSARSLPHAYARARFILSAALLLLACLLAPNLAFAASLYCPTLSATVAAGGSVTIDVSNCDGPTNIGVGSDDSTQTAHGSFVISAQSGSAGTQTVTYTHNGDSATSDTFPLYDEDENTITVNITITQAATPTASITVSPSSLNENSGSAFTYTVTLSASRTSATTVNLSRSGTATSDTDFTGAVSSVTVAANATTASFAITPAADSTVEQDETIIFTLASGTGYSIGSPSSATATIVNDDALALAPTSLPAGTAGTAYSQTFTTSNGTSPYSYARTAGTLPSGLSLNSDVLSGTPSVAGSYTFTITTTDQSGYQTSRSYSLTIAAPSIAITPTTLSAATRDSAYSQTLTASGGASPYTYAVTSGTLPTDMALSTAGVLSGTPSAAGSFSFTVTATDANGYTGSRAYSLTVSAPALELPATTLASGTAGTAYSEAINPATGGTTPYTYALSAGALPSNISVDSGTGALSGTPTVAGTFNFTLTVTDAANVQASRTYSLTIAAPGIALAPTSLAGATRGTAYSQTLAASGGATPYTYAVTSGTLPTDMALSTAGVLSGTPSVDGSFSFTVTATDANGFTGSQAYSLTVSAPALELPATTLASGTAGTAYSAAINPATGGTTPYTYALSAGALPNGIGVNSGTGTLSGTPTVAGTFSFTLTVTDAANVQASRAYSLTIAAPGISLTPATLPAATRGTAYSQTLTASGGASPYTYAVTSGALPTNMALSTGGVLSGTPSVDGSFSFTVTATDANGFTGSQAYSLTVSAPALELPATTLASGTAGTAYSAAINPATGGTTPYTYALSAGALPSNISVSSGTGALSGTPTVAGTFNFTLTVTDAANVQASRAYSLTIAAPGISLTPATLPAATRGTAYSQTLAASGGVAPYSYAVTSGTLPTDVTLSTGGVLSGTPSVDGSFSFTVTATDANGFTGSQAYSLTVSAPALALPATTLASGTAGTAYSAAINPATGGTTPYTYVLSAGALPNNISVNSGTGALSGTPTVAGTFNFTLTVTDAANVQASRAYSLTIAAPGISLTPATLPAAVRGTAYSQTLTASGGTAPYSYAVTSGTLPNGVSLATGGVLAGDPSIDGTFNFTVTATDAHGFTGSQAYALTVSAPALALPATTLASGTAGTAYSAAINPATGGTTPYTYALSAGALPNGLGVNSSTGALNGTPTVAGTFNFTLTVTDSAAAQATRAYTLTIDAPGLNIAPPSLPAATRGTAYSQTLTASGGVAPYSYAVTAGALPNGVTLATGGSLAGTPSAEGSFNFTVTATDANGFTGTRTYALTVAGPALALPATTLPAGTAGQAYSAPINPATGGTTPYTYALSAGALPNGVTVNAATGALSGTPTVAGSFNFTLTVTDSAAAQAPRGYTLTIAAPGLTLAPPSLPAATRGTAYSQTLTASGGLAPYSYAVTAGALPNGVTLATGGSLAGTPSADGSFNFTVTATDANGFTGTHAYVLTVAGPALALPATALPAGTAGQAYTAAINPATGGTTPYTYALTAGALPTGITVNAATGALSGTPTVAGNFNFSLTVTDSAAAQATRSYSLTIAAPGLAIAPPTLPAATRGTAYSQTLTASGGVAPYSYAVTAGALPAGVTLAGSGSLSGTPGADGSFNFTVTATDANGFTGTHAYVLTVAGPALALPATALPAGIAGQAYTAPINPATGGTAPYSYVITAGALPTGVVVNVATGALSGTPTVAGTFNFTLTVTESAAAQATRAYSLTIVAPGLAIAPPTLPAATRGTAYSQTLTTSGGVAPYSYAVTAGALPNGVALATGGNLAGTPSADGSFNFTVTATDANGFTGTHAYVLSVAGPTLALPATALPAGTAGQAYAAPINPATGGTAPYSYAVTAGALPAGVVVDVATGALSGTPTVAGSFNFTLTVTDSAAAQAARAYTLTIAAPGLAITPPTLPAATRGTAYSQTLTASGGVAPYRYAVTAGALPAGVTLATGGSLAGTPSVDGSFNFTVTATDANGFTGTRAYVLTVASPTLVLPATALPAGRVGQAYSATVNPATGGTAPYRYALTAGALPAGVTVDAATGTLGGTPTAAGSFGFTLTASDATPGTPAQASRSYVLTIAAPALVIAQSTLSSGVLGTAYSQTLGASGGVAPYRFSISAGALPQGLALASTGTLSGTPSAEGSFGFTVTVTDAAGFTAAQAYTLAIGSAAPVAVDDTAATLSDTAVTIAATANDTGKIESLALAAVPEHGSAAVNGLNIVYTPTAGYSGSDVLRYTVTGPGGTSAAASVTITVNARPVAASSTASATPGQSQSVDITSDATGGPFVAATVVSVSPANAGSASIVRSSGASAARLATAAAEDVGYLLQFTPDAAFSGQATVRFTLSNAYATSAEASVVFTVAPRRDPSTDAEVRGLINAQAESTRRFAKAQIDNFQRRLEATHHGDLGFSNRLSFQSTSQCREAERGLDAQPCSPATAERDDGLAEAGALPAPTPQDAPGELGLWVGGAIRSGSLDRQDGNTGVDFQSDGLSVGADYRVGASLAVGAGVGWGRDDSDVGKNGSHSKGVAYTLAMYASYHPGRHFFFDTLLGYQLLTYDLRRYVTDDGSLADGSRGGRQWIASVSTGADLQRGTMQVTPYARVDLARAKLDGYAETSPAPYALRYGDMDVNTTTGNLGVRLEWRREVSWGRFVPQLRIEYQHDFQGRGGADLSYADLDGGPYYRSALSVYDRNRLMLGVGGAFVSDGGLSTRLEYRAVTDGDSGRDQSWMLNIEKKY